MSDKPELETHVGNGEGPSVEPAMRYPPRFWKDEVSGVLAPAIRRFLMDQTQLKDIPVLRAYFRQWIDSPAWDANPAHSHETRTELGKLRHDAAAIQTLRDIRRWVQAAVDFGVDPL